MNWDAIASALAISAGAVVMAAAIFRFGPILETTPYLEPRERQRLERFLKIHRALMGFFFIGYLVVLIGVVFDSPLLSNLLIGAIFFFGALFVHTTVTLQRRMLRGVLNQAAANLKRREADQRSEAKSRFLAHMSHEIRTPMNAILGYAQLLQRESGLSERQQEHLETISRSGQHLLSLINDVLDMAKIEAGQLTRVEEQVDLRDMVVDLERMFHIRAVHGGLQFGAVVHDDVPPAVITDSGKVRQVLINLLSNAFKFTDQGHVTMTMNSFSLDERWIQIVVSVEDTGQGIAADYLEHVFGAFKQAESASSTTGTGLGLAVSRRFAHLLDGDLTVSSELGQGSNFRFTFKAQRGMAIEHGYDDSHVVGLMPDSKVAKILVVDDQADNRDLLCSLLRTVGFNVRSASNGEEALAAVAMEDFDLMLLDLRMPGIGGLEVIDHLRRPNLERRLPIVIVSASALETEQSSAIDRGADGFLSKPVNDRDLFAMIERLVEVDYRRSNHEPVPSDDSTTSIKSKPSNPLPDALVEALCEAAQRGDIEAISAYIVEVIDRDRALGEQLKGLADQFNYDALIAALKVTD